MCSIQFIMAFQINNRTNIELKLIVIATRASLHLGNVLAGYRFALCFACLGCVCIKNNNVYSILFAPYNDDQWSCGANVRQCESLAIDLPLLFNGSPVHIFYRLAGSLFSLTCSVSYFSYRGGIIASAYYCNAPHKVALKTSVLDGKRCVIKSSTKECFAVGAFLRFDTDGVAVAIDINALTYKYFRILSDAPEPDPRILHDTVLFVSISFS